VNPIGPPAVEVKLLSKKFGSFVANENISFQLKSGSLTCLLGPNGAGKTTLVRQLMALERPSEGTIRLGGSDLLGSLRLPSEVCAYLPQRGFPFGELTVLEAIEFSARLRGVGSAAARKCATQELERWGLETSASKMLFRLSGGQQRLVGLAATLVGEREILILDEPTNDVDPELRSRIWDCLAERRTLGHAILIVTHNIHEVERVASDALIMGGGRLLASGSIPELRRQFGAADESLLLRVPSVDIGSWLLARGFKEVSSGCGEFTFAVRTAEIDSVCALISTEFGPSTLLRMDVAEANLQDIYLKSIDTRDLVDSVF
jgi:ABC-2 type transport system ATP-binding protein